MYIYVYKNPLSVVGLPAGAFFSGKMTFLDFVDMYLSRKDIFISRKDIITSPVLRCCAASCRGFFFLENDVPGFF